jgi:predicted transcriptional regulator YdeE/catechol 2,3-dioxygenase-like lactoylglutathione lyase family enzyme
LTVATANELGPAVAEARRELQLRMTEIAHIRNAHMMYGISPPNYKGNPGPLDFYVCVAVERLTGLPPGMVHLRLEPQLYAVVTYQGPTELGYQAYDFTSQWLRDNGYEYDDTEYYYETYEETANADGVTEKWVYSPIKPLQAPAEPAIDSIGRTVVLVRDLQEARRFYCETLGFTVIAQFGRSVHVGPDGQRPVGLWLIQATGEELLLVGKQTGREPLAVLYTDDCRRAYETLKERGVRFHGEPRDSPDDTVVHFDDLYGNHLVLVSFPRD